MPGSPFQKRKYREIAEGIGSHIHVEVVAEEIAFPVGVPSSVAVRLEVMAFAVTGRTAFFVAVRLYGQGAVTGRRQMFRADQPIADRKIQELMPVELENKEKGIFRL